MPSGRPLPEPAKQPEPSDSALPAEQPQLGVNPWSALRPRAELQGSEAIDMAVAVSLLGPDVAPHVADGSGSRWALHAAGKGIREGSVDILRLEQLAGLWGRTIRWFSNVLFPTRGAVPAAAMASTRGSLIIEFVPGLHEEPVIWEDGREDYPTLVAGRYLTALLRADPEDLDGLSEWLSMFSGYAVNSYSKTVRFLAEQEVHVELVVPKPENPRQLVLGNLPIARAQREAGLLDRKPRIVTNPEVMIGVLEQQAWTATTFELHLEDGRSIKGTYPERLRDQLRPLLGRRVSARIEVTAPEHDWLPSSSRIRKRYRLVGIRAA